MPLVCIRLLAMPMALLAMAGAATAGPFDLRGWFSDDRTTPQIVGGDPAGEPPDSPDLRIDPNLRSSPWTGVVSINIRYGPVSTICSGALLSRWHVMTAGHCVDTTNRGDVIDLAQPGNEMRVVFNAGPGPGSVMMNVSRVDLHPDFAGFNVCPPGVAGDCLNDDIAIVTLAEEAPRAARSYSVLRTPMSRSDAPLKMVGYGRSGTGIDGYTVSPQFSVKRTGDNHADLYFGDDELSFAGPQEVWQADFDGVLGGVLRDTHCSLYGVCTPVLANDVEAALAPGDSGGAAFRAAAGGGWVLVGNNTYGRTFEDGQVGGTFGTAFGGLALAAYTDWLVATTQGAVVLVPEPPSAVLSLFGLAALATAMRLAPRRKA